MKKFFLLFLLVAIVGCGGSQNPGAPGAPAPAAGGYGKWTQQQFQQEVNACAGNQYNETQFEAECRGGGGYPTNGAQVSPFCTCIITRVAAQYDYAAFQQNGQQIAVEYQQAGYIQSCQQQR